MDGLTPHKQVLYTADIGVQTRNQLITSPNININNSALVTSAWPLTVLVEAVDRGAGGGAAPAGPVTPGI